MRTFIAIFPPFGVRASLLRAARCLSAEENIRWSPPENVHLTLKFLGDVSNEKLDGIMEVMGRACGRHRPFEAATSGFGAFPSTGKARVVWADVSGGRDELCALVEDLESSLGSLGFAPESRRAFRPHVTLGRVRGRPVALGHMETIGQDSRFMVREVALARSVPGVGGAEYSTLAAYPLTGR